VIQHSRDHSKYVVAVKWSPDGLLFATASHDHSVGLHKLNSETNLFQLVDKIPFNTNAEAISFNKSGVLCVGVRDDNYLHMLDLNGGKV
jgi:WD40 repeat protein